MSYDREESYGRHERHHHHHDGHQQESRGQYGGDNEFQRNRAGERDGYMETGGYGPESQDPEYRERYRREEQQREEQRFGGGSEIPGSYGAGSRIKEPNHRQYRNEYDQDSEYQVRQDTREDEYQRGYGRRVVGSGVNSVELSEGGNQDFRSDAYGGESGTYGTSYDEQGRTSEAHHGREHHPNRVAQEEEATGYGGGNERRHQQYQERQEYEGQGRQGRNAVGTGVDSGSLTGEGERRHQQYQEQQQYEEYEGQGRQGRNTVGTGVDSVSLTGEGDSRRTGDMYGGESGTSGNNYANQSSSTGEWDVSSGQKYTPGAKVRLHAAEMESERNPFNGVATGLAGETQGLLKIGLKNLEKKLEDSFRD